jgi:hypothetical protein
MFNSNILDVAVGLVFIFLLLSLICSAANEILESFLKQRAANLERGIKELVGGDHPEFVAALYNHGLIFSLFRGKYEPAPGWKFWKRANLPSYIPAKNFALALLDLSHTFKDLPPNIQSVLDACKKNAGNDAAKLQRNIEEWFNSSMDRVSGWYKRYSQRIVLVMGLVAAVLVNADCIQIAKRLLTDASLRGSISTLADSATSRANPAIPTGSSFEQVRNNLQTLENIGLPLGWFHPKGEPVRYWDELKDHWMGWLLTALAVSLGAPFWFDVLNKIIVVRSTVKPAEKSSPEASKDAAPPAPLPTPITLAQPAVLQAPPSAADEGVVVAAG